MRAPRRAAPASAAASFLTPPPRHPGSGPTEPAGCTRGCHLTRSRGLLPCLELLRVHLKPPIALENSSSFRSSSRSPPPRSPRGPAEASWSIPCSPGHCIGSRALYLQGGVLIPLSHGDVLEAGTGCFFGINGTSRSAWLGVMTQEGLLPRRPTRSPWAWPAFSSKLVSSTAK